MATAARSWPTCGAVRIWGANGAHAPAPREASAGEARAQGFCACEWLRRGFEPPAEQTRQTAIVRCAGERGAQSPNVCAAEVSRLPLYSTSPPLSQQRRDDSWVHERKAANVSCAPLQADRGGVGAARLVRRGLASPRASRLVHRHRRSYCAMLKPGSETQTLRLRVMTNLSPARGRAAKLTMAIHRSMQGLSGLWQGLEQSRVGESRQSACAARSGRMSTTHLNYRRGRIIVVVDATLFEPPEDSRPKAQCAVPAAALFLISPPA